MRRFLALSLLSSFVAGSAFAQAPQASGGYPNVGATLTAVSTTPATIATYTVTTTAGTAIAASSVRQRLSYQVQGSGYGCASWVTATVTISANSATAVCTGAGAFLVTTGSVSNFGNYLLPNTVMTVIGATGSTLTIVADAQ